MDAVTLKIGLCLFSSISQTLSLLRIVLCSSTVLSVLPFFLNVYSTQELNLSSLIHCAPPILVFSFFSLPPFIPSVVLFGFSISPPHSFLSCSIFPSPTPNPSVPPSLYISLFPAQPPFSPTLPASPSLWVT